MLEVVCVERAVGQGLVRQDVIVIGDDLELVAFVGEGLLDLLEDLGVRGGAGADGDDFVIGRGGVLVVGGLAAAGTQCDERERQHEGEDEGRDLFHGRFSFIFLFLEFVWFRMIGCAVRSGTFVRGGCSRATARDSADAWGASCQVRARRSVRRAMYMPNSCRICTMMIVSATHSQTI